MIRLNFVNFQKEIFLLLNNSCKYEFGDFVIIVIKSFISSFDCFDVVKKFCIVDISFLV